VRSSLISLLFASACAGHDLYLVCKHQIDAFVVSLDHRMSRSETETFEHTIRQEHQ